MKDHQLPPIHNSPWTVNWQDEDSDKLKTFIESKTGVKLIELLRSRVGMMESPDKSYSLGYAIGGENLIAELKQIPYAPIVQYVPQTQVEVEEERAKHDSDNISFPELNTETD